MEKDWPGLEECGPYRLGLMDAALRRYTWEEEGYNLFDSNSVYPPIPEELPWLRKLFEITRNKPRPLVNLEDTANCPICHHPGYIGDGRINRFIWNPLPPGEKMDSRIQLFEIGKHPVWDMDPIPCPFHILEHLYGPPFIGLQRPSLITPEDLDEAKRFLKQLRDSRGYDVDCYPHPYLVIGASLRRYSKARHASIFPHLSGAIDLIKDKTDKQYELLEIIKVVAAFSNRVFLVTFTAKAPNSPVETFLATLDLNKSGDPVVVECFLQPKCNAPLPDHLPPHKMETSKPRCYWPVLPDLRRSYAKSYTTL